MALFKKKKRLGANSMAHGVDLEPSEYHHIKEKKKKFWLFR
ncbi:hypothetical protein [Lactiplantibacillus pentosus]|nr:hypothetical protein [Lactiplantibacillus pentosus]